jgi:hypothetical protein
LTGLGSVAFWATDPSAFASPKHWRAIAHFGCSEEDASAIIIDFIDTVPPHPGLQIRLEITDWETLNRAPFSLKLSDLRRQANDLNQSVARAFYTPLDGRGKWLKGRLVIDRLSLGKSMSGHLTMLSSKQAKTTLSFKASWGEDQRLCG